MSLSVSAWVKTHPLYTNAIKERDALQVEVDDIRLALKGAKHSHRVEHGLLDSDINRLRDEQDSLSKEIEELRTENEALEADAVSRATELATLEEQHEDVCRAYTELEQKLTDLEGDSLQVVAVG